MREVEAFMHMTLPRHRSSRGGLGIGNQPSCARGYFRFTVPYFESVRGPSEVLQFIQIYSSRFPALDVMGSWRRTESEAEVFGVGVSEQKVGNGRVDRVVVDLD